MRLPIFTVVGIVTLAAAHDLAAAPTTMPTELTCTLSPKELEARRHELVPGLFKKARSVEDVNNGLRFTFDNKPGLLADLFKVVEGEQDCCSFLKFEMVMEPSAGPIHFTVTGPKGTEKMLRKL